MYTFKNCAYFNANKFVKLLIRYYMVCVDMHKDEKHYNKGPYWLERRNIENWQFSPPVTFKFRKVSG